MNKSVDECDYDTIQILSIKHNQMISGADLEKKNYNECTWANSYADRKLEEHLKM